jgi:pimeloyl-ACP methyl ester carboxylesterase
MRGLILPGLGADAAMYAAPEYRLVQGVEFLDWPAHRGESSIGTVARRIIVEHALGPNDLIGGSSLGGMIAAEIATQIQVRKVLLIGSALHPSEVNPALRAFADGAEFIPIPLLQAISGTLSAGQQESLLAMFRRADPAFVRVMAKAIFEWKGADAPSGPVSRIHGALDGVIFPPARGAEIIPDGGHLIAMTHPERVAEFIRREME